MVILLKILILIENYQILPNIVWQGGTINTLLIYLSKKNTVFYYVFLIKLHKTNQTSLKIYISVPKSGYNQGPKSFQTQLLEELTIKLQYSF